MEANKHKGDPAVFNDVLLLDEMSIQKDLQVCKKGSKWKIVGAVDLGPLVNSLEELKQRKSEVVLATHCFQYLYVSFNSFTWPVCYYGSHNVNGHSIYLTFWPLVDTLQSYGFKVHRALMDGGANNCQFSKLILSGDSACMSKYITFNAYHASGRMALAQDCKHVFKKIRNSLLSSTTKPDAVRQVTLHGQPILCQYFQEAYHYNCKNHLRIYRRLTKEHMYLTAQAKIRNYLSTDVLSEQMLNLFVQIQSHIENPSKLDSTIELLKHTSILVDIFCNVSHTIENMYDSRIAKLLQVSEFFHSWEKEYESSKDLGKFLITRQTR